MSEKEENHTEISPNKSALDAKSEALPQEKERLEKEIADKFCEIQSKLRNAANGNEKYTNADGKRDWNEFTEQFLKFFKEVRESNLQLLEGLNSLADFKLRINPRKTPVIRCAGWSFHFSVNFCNGILDGRNGEFQSVDFFEAKFYGQVQFHFSNFAEKVVFGRAKFLGDKERHFINLFANCCFAKEVDFALAEFCSRFFILSSKFLGNVSFFAAKFAEGACLEDSKFDEDVDFERAIFVKNTSFFRAVFRKNANFFGISFLLVMMISIRLLSLITPVLRVIT